jgi:Cu/Ag efflux protein CusF
MKISTAKCSVLLRACVVVSVLALGAACASRAAEPHPAGASHRGTGVIVALDAAKGRVKIKHEKIEGYMDPMTMWFEVKDPKLLEGLAPNDRVEFVVTEETSADIVTEIKKV